MAVVLKYKGVNVYDIPEAFDFPDIVINNFTEYKEFISQLRNDFKLYDNDIDVSSEILFVSFVAEAFRVRLMCRDLYDIAIYVSPDSSFYCYKLKDIMFEGSEYDKISVIEKPFNIKIYGVDVAIGQEWQYLEYLARYISLNAQYLFDKYSLTSQEIPSGGFKYFKFLYQTNQSDYLQVLFSDGSLDTVHFVLYVDITAIKSFLVDIFSYITDIYPGSAVGYLIAGYTINTITQRNATPIISGDNNSYYTKLEIEEKLSERDLQITALKSLILNISSVDSGAVSNSNTKIDETQFAELKEVLKAFSISALMGVK